MNLSCFKPPALSTQLIERVLIVHPFGIGDALFMTPAIRSLKESGIKQIDLLLGSRTRELFEHNPHVNQIFEWDKSPFKGTFETCRRFGMLAQLFWTLRRNRYQAMLDFSVGGQYAFLSRALFSIPIRIGFSFQGRGIFLTHKIEIPDGYVGKSVVEHYFDLTRFVGTPSPSGNKRPELFLGECDRQGAEAVLAKLGLDTGRPFLAVAPGGGESWGRDARLKRWPVEYFADLINKIHRNYGALFEKVLVLGGQNEHGLGARLVQALSGISAHNLCGSTSIRVAAALIQKALFLLANDGGLVHIAHTVGTPLIAVYGPVDPLVYGPYPVDSKALTLTNKGPACRPCYQRFRYQAACAGVECLTRLTADRVLEETQLARFLGRLCTDSVFR